MDLNPNERRYKVLPIDPYILIDFLRDGVPRRVRVEPPLPADVQVLSVQANWYSHAIEFLLTSQEYEPVPPQQEAPRLHGVLCYVEDRADV